jgi:hypothetical protein
VGKSAIEVHHRLSTFLAKRESALPIRRQKGNLSRGHRSKSLDILDFFEQKIGKLAGNYFLIVPA